MPIEDDRLPVLEHRVEKLEEDNADIKQLFARLITVEERNSAQSEKAEILFDKIEKLNDLLLGTPDKQGVLTLLYQANKRLENHTWALRLIAGTLASVLAGAVWMH